MQRDELDQATDDPIVHHLRSEPCPRPQPADGRITISTAWAKALELEARPPSTIKRSRGEPVPELA